MTRTPLFVANWKMNTDLPQALTLAEAAAAFTPPLTAELDIVLAPPFPWIVPVANALGSSHVRVGAQDVSPEDHGAFTGDVSAEMLSDWASLVIVGHSERRAGHGETDELIARKTHQIVAHGMTPLLCVGETLAEREAGQAEAAISRQIRTALGGCTATQLDGLVIAYEPVWAIGTGHAATPDDAQAIAAMIRRQLDASTAANARILYGGSVTPENVAELTSGEDVDGTLVGSASLTVEGFLGIASALTPPRELF